MNFSNLFVRRPVATTLIQLAIVIFGIAAYRVLPVSDLPPIDFPTSQVNASLPGANPDTLAAAVATPLEKQFSTIPGVTQITSTSALGNTSITLQFDLERDIDAAAQDVQAMIARAARQLPQMPTPPSYNKVNPGDQPVIFLSLRSATLPLSTVKEYAETIGQRISMVSGVAQVQLFGAAKYAVRVDLDYFEMWPEGCRRSRASLRMRPSLVVGVLRWRPHVRARRGGDNREREPGGLDDARRPDIAAPRDESRLGKPAVLAGRTEVGARDLQWQTVRHLGL